LLDLNIKSALNFGYSLTSAHQILSQRLWGWSTRTAIGFGGGLGGIQEGSTFRVISKFRANELQLNPQAEVNWVGNSQGDIVAAAVDVPQRSGSCASSSI